MDKIKNKIELFIGLILLVVLVVFGYFKGTAFWDLYTYNEDLEASIIEVESNIDGLNPLLTEGHLVFNETDNSKNEEIAGVFPSEEDLTSLNRAFDQFELDNNYSNNPVFISSISYKESYEADDGNYMVLPLSMKVDSSEENFYKFLEYIETSGNLDNQVRLMEVTDVSISVADSGDDDMISFSLELNAYFQQ